MVFGNLPIGSPSGRQALLQGAAVRTSRRSLCSPPGAHCAHLPALTALPCSPPGTHRPARAHLPALTALPCSPPGAHRPAMLTFRRSTPHLPASPPGAHRPHLPALTALPCSPSGAHRLTFRRSPASPPGAHRHAPDFESPFKRRHFLNGDDNDKLPVCGAQTGLCGAQIGLMYVERK